MTDPICTNLATADCFAKVCGRRKILTDTNFQKRKDRRCPFYKSKEFKNIQDSKIKVRLENIARGSE